MDSNQLTLSLSGIISSFFQENSPGSSIVMGVYCWFRTGFI
jgi:hypothetical protein